MPKRIATKTQPAPTAKSRKRPRFCGARDAATKAWILHIAQDSILFRLPLEIRDRIYRQLLGDRVIHMKIITHVPYRMSRRWETPYRRHLASIGVICYNSKSDFREEYWSHAVCQVPETIDQDYQVFQTNRCVDQEQYSSHSGCNRAVRDCKTITLKECIDLRVLRSCRQLYNECSSILYTTNTFAFDDPISCSSFMYSRCPNQKNLLRSLYIHQRYKESWSGAIRRQGFESFEGLRTVRFMLEDHDLNDNFNYEKQNDPALNRLLGNSMLAFRTLKDLKKATIIIQCNPKLSIRSLEDSQTIVKRRRLAASMEAKLVDPNSAEILRQEIADKKAERGKAAEERDRERERRAIGKYND